MVIFEAKYYFRELLSPPHPARVGLPVGLNYSQLSRVALQDSYLIGLSSSGSQLGELRQGFGGSRDKR